MAVSVTLSRSSLWSWAMLSVMGSAACEDPKSQDPAPAPQGAPEPRPAGAGGVEAKAGEVMPGVAEERPKATGDASGAAGDGDHPTAEEARGTPLPARAVVVADPSPRSKLPCPPGTTQESSSEVLSCRRPPEHRAGIPPKEGPSLWFHPNGALAQEGYYANNQRTGAWWSFRADGSLENFASYRDGEYDGLYVNFYPDGRRQSETPFKAGKQHGTSKMWSEEGKLLTMTTYVDGKVTAQKMFRGSMAGMKPASEAEVAAMKEELRRLEEEQRRLLDSISK